MSPKKSRKTKKRSTRRPRAKQELDTEARLKKYENLRDILTKKFEMCKEQWVQTDVEWLSLCNMAEQTNTTETNHPVSNQGTGFKDATELNTIPLTLKNEIKNFEDVNFQDEIETESGDET